MKSASDIFNQRDVKSTMLYYFDEQSKSWIPVEFLKRPVKVNYRYDANLDTAQVEFISYNLNRKLPNNTFARLVYEDYEAKWDVNKKPINFDDFIIVEGSCSHLPNTEHYNHSYNLTEPIQLLKEIRMETLSFTNITKISVKDASTGVTTTYIKEPYNLYSMIERILKVTRYKTDLEDKSLINDIEIMDIELLKASGVNADDVFIENTVFDALMKIGQYVSRVPVLYLNKDYDSNNPNSKKYLLFFERTDGLGGNVITEEEFFARNKGYVESEMPERNAGIVVSDVRNMVGNTISYYPTENYFIAPHGLESSLHVSTSEDRMITLHYNIQDIVQLIQLSAVTADSLKYRYTDYPIKEYKEWLILDNNTNIAYFKEGENTIYNLPKPADQNDRYWYNVRYYPLVDTKVKFKNNYNDYEGETTFNQTENFLDASTYGNMLQEYINEYGSADITLTKTVKKSDSYNTYVDDIFKPGTLIRFKNGDKYLITSTSFDTTLDGYNVIYQANKNYVRRNYFTKANEKIREYGIPYDKIYERMTNIEDTILLNLSTSAVIGSNVNKYLNNKKLVLSGLFTNQSNIKNEFVQMALLIAKSTVKKENGSTVEFVRYTQCPIARTQSGTSVILNIKAQNNKIIGLNRYYGTISENGKLKHYIMQKPINYADPFGCIQTLSIGFSKYKEVPEIEIGALFDPSYSLMNNYINFTRTFPSELGIWSLEGFDSEHMLYYNNCEIKIPNLIYEKDSAEQLNISYQLFFKGKGRNIVTPELAKFCGYLGEHEPTTLYIVISSQEINESDIITTSMITQISTVSSAVWNVNRVELALSNGINIESNNYFALCIKENNVYKPLIINVYEDSTPTTNQRMMYINM